ncbi:prolactin-releasing peptide receptor [Orussus abietinus]|uniref:prolactin-releasing peptide receptor n=1 Tax=Orussus abietinus TaxID=222816 RepID=UPI0006256644|nr:prolactin-releasing peptide receptor [Orussus abietinus]XP_012286111.1 prolactin-releasing peptide receptor [Orussus abietinus]
MNDSEVDSVDFEDPTKYLPAKVIFSGLYLTIFLLGIFGNVAVCFVVARNRQMQTVTNLFIANLALSDVLLCALCVPFTPLYKFLEGWVFGRFLCHLVTYAQCVSVYISTLTLTSIAVDRYLVILYPYRPRMKVGVCLAVIFGIWVVGLLLTLPYGLFMSLRLEGSHAVCEEAWPSEPFRKAVGSLNLLLQFVLPFVAISFCYTCVSLRLRVQARSRPGNKSGRREEADRERKRRTNRMLVAMVVIFGISWLPLNVANVVNDYFSSANEWSYYNLVFFASHCLAMSSTCYNPFLYAWLNDNFRKEFKQVLPCFLRRPAPNGTDTVQESLLLSQSTKANHLELSTVGAVKISTSPNSKDLEDDAAL